MLSMFRLPALQIYQSGCCNSRRSVRCACWVIMLAVANWWRVVLVDSYGACYELSVNSCAPAGIGW